MSERRSSSRPTAHGSGSEQACCCRWWSKTAALRTDQTDRHGRRGLSQRGEPPGAVRARACRRSSPTGSCAGATSASPGRAATRRCPIRSTTRASSGQALEGQVPAERLHLRSGHPHLHLPRRQAALLHRQRLLDQWPQASQVPGRQTRLRALRAARHNACAIRERTQTRQVAFFEKNQTRRCPIPSA